MPPKKRSAGKSTATRPARAKRPRPSVLQEIAPAEIETSRPTRAEPAPPQGLVSIDVSAISTTISAVVSQAPAVHQQGTQSNSSALSAALLP